MLRKTVGSAITILIILFLLMLGPVNLKEPSKMLHQTNAYGYGGGGGHSSPVMVGWRPSGTEVEEEEEIINISEEVEAEEDELAQEPETAEEAEEVKDSLGEITGAVVGEPSTNETEKEGVIAGLNAASLVTSIMVLAAIVLALGFWLKRRKEKKRFEP